MSAKLWTALAIAAAVTAGGCETVDAEGVGAPGYPTLADIPAAPKSLKSPAEYEAAVRALDAARDAIVNDPDIAAPEARGDIEEFVDDAKKLIKKTVPN